MKTKCPKCNGIGSVVVDYKECDACGGTGYEDDAFNIGNHFKGVNSKARDKFDLGGEEDIPCEAWGNAAGRYEDRARYLIGHMTRRLQGFGHGGAAPRARIRSDAFGCAGWFDCHNAFIPFVDEWNDDIVGRYFFEFRSVIQLDVRRAGFFLAEADIEPVADLALPVLDIAV